MALSSSHPGPKRSAKPKQRAASTSVPAKAAGGAAEAPGPLIVLAPPETAAPVQAPDPSPESAPPDLDQDAFILPPADPSSDRTAIPLPVPTAAALPLSPPRDTAADAEAPVEPAPAATRPPPPPAAAKRRKSGGRMGVLIVLLLLILLGGALYFLLAAAPHNEDPAAPGSSAPLLEKIQALLPARWFRKPASAPQPAPPPPAPLSAPIQQAQQVIQAVLATRATNHSTDASAPAPTAPAEDDPAVPPVASRALPRPPRPGDSKTTPAVVPPEPPAILEWPAIELTAIVGGGTRGSALINGDLLTVGEENVDGVTLVKIESQAALLQFNGQQRRFTVKKK